MSQHSQIVRPSSLEAVQSTQVTLSSRMEDAFDLVPVDRAEFAAEIVPCLALTSGVGMSNEDQRIWLNAAYKALDGIPIKLLKRGADAAMKTADHPSKIVPAIMNEIRETWDWRKRWVAQRARVEAPPAAPVIDPAEQAEVKAMMSDLARKLSVGASNA